MKTTSFEDMSHLQPMQHSLDPADGHLDNMIFGHFNLNDGNDESHGLQPTLNARMTDEQSTLNYPLVVVGGQ
ncbi:unnamed protein product [Clavelina lepadiformis]|uniref:Uncharacterized protein n=1 Tax=Clavelina lepadiformis TaxID=159417 RepID=A0ABP0EWS5_CLALP